MRIHARASSTTPNRRMTEVAGAAIFAFMLLGASACGASAGVEVVAQPATEIDAASAQADGDAEDTTAAENTRTESAGETADTVEADTAPASDRSSDTMDTSQGTFELVLENGETFSAPITCVLTPQVAAGSEILFTAVGQHEGQLFDVTQWGVHERCHRRRS